MEKNNYTLEDMRVEFDAFKDALSRQEILNDDVLRQAMRSKVSGIRNRSVARAACAVFVILASPFAFHFNPAVNASWAFVIVTDLLMLLCVCMDWRFRRNVQRVDLSSCDLLTFSKDVRRLKVVYKGWMKWIALPAALWLFWLSCEIWRNYDDPGLAVGLIVPLSFGFVIGAVAGFLMNRRTIKTCDEIINSIEE